MKYKHMCIVTIKITIKIKIKNKIKIKKWASIDNYHKKKTIVPKFIIVSYCMFTAVYKSWKLVLKDTDKKKYNITTPAKIFHQKSN